MERLGLFLAKLFLDWAYPKILHWIQNMIGAAREKAAYDKANEALEKANKKVADEIERAAEATSNREARREAARNNTKPNP